MRYSIPIFILAGNLNTLHYLVLSIWLNFYQNTIFVDLHSNLLEYASCTAQINQALFIAEKCRFLQNWKI